MTSDIVDPESMSRRPRLVIYVEEGGELAPVGEGDAPEVEGAVGVLRNHLNDRGWLVLVRNAGILDSFRLFFVGLKFGKFARSFFVTMTKKISKMQLRLY